MGVSTPSPFTMDSDAEEERQLLSVFSAEDVAPLLNSLFDFRYQAPCVNLDEDKTIVDLVDKLTSALSQVVIKVFINERCSSNICSFSFEEPPILPPHNGGTKEGRHRP